MREYQPLIDKNFGQGDLVYPDIIPKELFGNKGEAEKYLEKYWLTKDEYEKVWKPIQDKIFINQDEGLPEVVFNEQYEMIALIGGILLDQDRFELLSECMKSCNDKHFVIIQNTFGGKLTDLDPIFRMKYQSNITWKDMNGGNIVSSELFKAAHDEYFVFSDTGKWGLYAANDYRHPLHIIGFKPELSSLFRQKFNQSDEEWQEIKEWLPPKYKDLIRN